MIVDAHELMPIICSALQRGQHVRLTATGGSMRPFMHNGDVVELEPLDSLPARGDVVLVRCGSERERYVLHRVVRVESEKLFIRGDAQEYCEGPYTVAFCRACMASIYSAQCLVAPAHRSAKGGSEGGHLRLTPRSRSFLRGSNCG